MLHRLSAPHSRGQADGGNMQVLALLLSLLTVTQATLAFVTGFGQGDQEVSPKINDVTTVPMTAGYSSTGDVSGGVFSDAIEATSTPLIMQTNNEDHESSTVLQYGTEQSAVPSEVVEHYDKGATELSTEVVTNNSAPIAEEHEPTDSSSSAATIEEDVQMITEEVEERATTGADSDETTGKSGLSEDQLEDVEVGKESETEGVEEEEEEEDASSQATAEEDQFLTTLAVDMESTGERENQTTKKEALSNSDIEITTETSIEMTSTVEPENQDSHSEIPSETLSSQVAEFDVEKEETVTIEEKGGVEDVASDFVDEENNFQGDEIHEPDSERSPEARSPEFEQSTTTDFTVGGSTDEEEPNDAMKEKVESVAMEMAAAETTTEMATTTVEADDSNLPSLDNSTREAAAAGIADSRVATVKAHITTSNKAVQRSAPWFHSLRMDIVQSLQGVKNSIYQAATSLQKAVEDLQSAPSKEHFYCPPRQRTNQRLKDSPRSRGRRVKSDTKSNHFQAD
ncbi:hypothetical protein TcWFU_010003 [Taenia crassiceps]|uniref:Uncharacterized protein n=1 Tax=Taenia crassiceps TaxID=6207 RepID=A0ABR4Q587_9CEST